MKAQPNSAGNIHACSACHRRATPRGCWPRSETPQSNLKEIKMNFTHVAVGTNDIAAARRFYDKVLATLGWRRIVDLGDTGSLWGKGTAHFMVTVPRDGQPATAGNRMTISFSAPDHQAVRAFHASAMAFGSPDEGAAGPRPWAPDARGGYTRAPDSNNLAVCGAAA